MTAQTIAHIITTIATHQVYMEIMEKYVSNTDDRYDLFQELLLKIVQMSPVKLIGIYTRGEFPKYFTGMVHRQVVSNTSTWHLKHRLPAQETNNSEALIYVSDSMNPEELMIQKEEYVSDAEIDIINREKKQLVITAINAIVKDDPKFLEYADQFKWWYFDGLSFRQIEKKTKVHYCTVRNHVRNAEIRIKTWIKKNGRDRNNN